MSNRRCIAGAIGIALMFGPAVTLSGEPPEPADAPPPTLATKEPSKPVSEGKQHPRMKTLGGRQVWGDVHWFRGWRIQQNVITEHFRLLDPADYRYKSGSLNECEKELARITTERELKPLDGRMVILIHGIMRSSKSFFRMQSELAAKGFEVCAFDYPSARVDVFESAKYLQRVIDSLDGIDEINFVVHSMGGIVVRSWLVEHSDPRVKRMVMLGVPNQGAQLASKLRDVGVFKAVFGPAGQQLVASPDGPIVKLPTPTFEFGVIAGARGTNKGFNPLITGDDDGVVSVQNTRLSGASDFMTVPALHSFLVLSQNVIDSSVRFLQAGAFRESGERQPIEQSAGRSEQRHGAKETRSRESD